MLFERDSNEDDKKDMKSLFPTLSFLENDQQDFSNANLFLHDFEYDFSRQFPAEDILEKQTDELNNNHGEKTRNNSQKSINLKNTYINKINGLISNSGINPLGKKIKKSLRQELEQSKSIKSESNIKSEDNTSTEKTELERINFKLQRNRESARNSRKRKKVYYDLLETKVAELTDELEKTKRKLQINEDIAFKSSKNNKILNKLQSDRQELYDKLEKVIKKESEETDLNLLIDSLRLRMGITGRERTHILEFLFHKIYELMFPPYIRYLLWISSSFKEKLEKEFETSNIIKWKTLMKLEDEDHIIGYLNLTENQKRILPKLQKNITKSFDNFKRLITAMNKIKNEINSEAQSLENISDDFRSIMKPSQTAALLLGVEKSKNQNRFSVSKLFLGENLEGDDDEDNEIDEELNEETKNESPEIVQPHKEKKNIKRRKNI